MGHNFEFSPVLQITSLNNCLRTDFPASYCFQGEFHPFWEMVYALEGTFRVASNDKVYTMQTGDVIFHKPMEFHRLWVDEEQRVQTYIIGFCGSGSLLRYLEGGAFVLNETQQKQLKETMAYAEKHFCRVFRHGWDFLSGMEQQPEKAVQIQSYVEQLKLFLLSLTQNTIALTVKEHSDSENSQIFRGTVQALTEHVTNGWISTEEIARQLHCSPTRIKRVFARYSDIGIHKYLLKLKTAQAINLLRSGVSCTEVSRSLGFSNQNYFSTVFKRETGYSPSDYYPAEGRRRV